MKDLTVLVSRYAQSLYDTAKDGGSVSDVRDELEVLTQSLHASGPFMHIALNQKAPSRVKAQIWNVLLEVAKCGDLTKSFVNLMINNSRIHLFPKIIKRYDQLRMKDSGVKSVTLYTSVKLTKVDSESIIKKLEKLLDTKVELESIVKPEILGGMIAQFDSYMIDASIKSKLNNIKSTLLS